MTSPSYKDRICAMFDSFSKKVLRNFVIAEDWKIQIQMHLMEAIQKNGGNGYGHTVRFIFLCLRFRLAHTV